MRKDGFTLVEILVVISILAFLVSLIVPNFRVLVDQFNKKLLEKERAVKEQVERYNLFICGKKNCERKQALH